MGKKINVLLCLTSLLIPLNSINIEATTNMEVPLNSEAQDETSSNEHKQVDQTSSENQDKNYDSEKTEVSLAIKNATITNVDATGYTIEADIQSDCLIKDVYLPTWTIRNGQDDVIWYKATLDDQNHISYRVNIKDHNYEDGDYLTHLYVYDTLGRQVMVGFDSVEIHKSPLQILNTKVTNVDGAGYTVEADIQSDLAVTAVEFPTWTNREGQDDIIWYKADVDQNNHVSYRVNIKNHGYEDGDYITHMYISDESGRITAFGFPMTEIKKTPLEIKNTKVTNVDGTGYTVEADIQSDYAVTAVEFPTWTIREGQDDIIWYKAAVDQNNHVSYRVNIKNHGYEDGDYITHMYISDESGRITASGFPMTEIKKTPLEIKNTKVTNVDGTGYTVEADIQSDYAVTAVEFPTWTNREGQDDIIWYKAAVDQNNHVSYRVNIKNHGYEDGDYITHMYISDESGRITSSGFPMTEIKKTPLEIKNTKVTNVDGAGYTVEADIQSDFSVTAVEFPTWTIREGQDDIIWYKAAVDQNNHVSYRVNIKNHGYEDGDYITHMYISDESGRITSSEFPITEIQKTPLEIKNTKVTNVDGTGYTVEADIQSDYAVTAVEFPTWTNREGQDDIIWYKATVDQNNHVSYRVNIKNHGYEDGDYITHMYVSDETGRITVSGFPMTEIKKTPLEIQNVSVSQVTSTGYTIDADINSDYGIDHVAYPTWTTYNGQDEIKWYNASLTGNHVTIRVSIKDHLFEGGEYTTHIYAYDNAGRNSVYSVQATITTNLTEGWNTIDNARCYKKGNGNLARNEFITENGNTYYFGNDCSPLTGEQSIGGRIYYFDTNFIMRTGITTLPDGRTFF